MRQQSFKQEAGNRRRTPIVRASDLGSATLSQVRVTTPGIDASTALLNGAAWSRDLLSGIRLHATATRCLRGFETECTLPPGLVCVLALDGQGLTEAVAEERPISFAPLPGREPRPEGFLLNVAQTCLVRRTSQRGLQTRKVSVSLPAAWLDRAGGEADGPIARFRRGHLAIRRWQPSPRLGEAAAKLLKLQDTADPLLASLATETLALQIAEHALRSLLLSATESLSERDCTEAARLQAIIEAHLTRPLPTRALAQEAGLSVRRANDVFQRAHGQSIASYIRSRRMEKAKDGLERSSLTIAQIGYLAGFSSPANFTTAFRKRFGLTPREARGS